MRKPYSVWPFYLVSASMVALIAMNIWLPPSALTPWITWIPGFALGYAFANIQRWTRENREWLAWREFEGLHARQRADAGQ